MRSVLSSALINNDVSVLVSGVNHLVSSYCEFQVGCHCDIGRLARGLNKLRTTSKRNLRFNLYGVASFQGLRELFYMIGNKAYIDRTPKCGCHQDTLCKFQVGCHCHIVSAKIYRSH